MDGEKHLVEVYEATVIATDYPVGVGARRFVARCCCGWSVVRQLRRATDDRVAKHFKEVWA